MLACGLKGSNVNPFQDWRKTRKLFFIRQKTMFHWPNSFLRTPCTRRQSSWSPWCRTWKSERPLVHLPDTCCRSVEGFERMAPDSTSRRSFVRPREWENTKNKKRKKHDIYLQVYQSKLNHLIKLSIVEPKTRFLTIWSDRLLYRRCTWKSI